MPRRNPPLNLVDSTKCSRIKQDGNPCRQKAGFGTVNVGVEGMPCKFHGGILPTVIQHYAVKRIEEALAVQGGAPLEVDPAQALLQEVWRSAGRVEWCRAKVIALTDDELVQKNEFGGQTLSIYVRFEQLERQNLVHAAKTCIQAGIAERHVKLEEERAKLVARAFQALMDDPELEMSPAQREAAPAAIRRALSLAS